MKDFLGAHMSIAGGLHKSIERAVAAGCGVLQIFTRSSNQWRPKPLSDKDAELFRKTFQESGLREVISHDIYLINLAAAPGDTRTKSIEAFRDELQCCARLGIKKVVMHPGSHLTDPPETGLRRVVEAFDQIFDDVPEYDGLVLLETTAGQGSNLGRSFEELRFIIEKSAYRDRFGICFDTCHTFAAGYDCTTKTGYERVMDEFDSLLGISRLQCFHMNDSKKGLGSRVDRHDHIGQGMMGLEPFRFIMKDARFEQVPKILETPPGDNDEMNLLNLETLRRLACQP